VNDAALRVPAVTAAQMREVDRLAVTRYGLQLIQMMEHAGRALAEVARDMLGGTAAGRQILVAAGRGDNGGGGIAAARHLANWGGDATLLVERAEAITGVAAQQLTGARAAGVVVLEGDAALGALSDGRPDLLIDALIGYGLTGGPRGWPAEVIVRANAGGVRTLSLDVPSGLDATTGECLEPCVRASATLTLALPKTGFLHPAGRAAAGTLYLADIGIPPRVYADLGMTVGAIFEREGIVRIDGLGRVHPRAD
jgi:NAD(P)H-hydrate epimerase